MNLRIDPIVNQPAQYKNNPKFGMAVKLNKSAIPVIKKQFITMANNTKSQEFIHSVRNAATNQARNPVNVVIKAAEDNSGKLVAEVVDSNKGNELGFSAKYDFVQSEIGKTDFIEKACNLADTVHIANYDTEKVLNILGVV